MAGPEPRLTGIVLAGGRSRRMGTDKAWLDWYGRPLVAHVAAALRAAGCAEVLAVGGDAARMSAHGLRPVPDAMPGEGPLQGLAAGLAAAAHPLALVVACDMPHLEPAALALLARLAAGHDAAVPWIEPGGWEPLHAAYGRSCLPAIRVRLAAGERRMTCFYGDVRVRAVSAGELAAADPSLASLRSVNTPGELAAARSQGVGSRRRSATPASGAGGGLGTGTGCPSRPG
jgi:molybdopterin-guanine dinucleotide biosynthesis protein A